MSVGCETPSLLLAFVPLLQEARPPVMMAPATNEPTTLENEWERRVEQNMGPPGVRSLVAGRRLRWLPAGALPGKPTYRSHANSRAVQRRRILTFTRSQKWYRPSPVWGEPKGMRYLVQLTTTPTMIFLQCANTETLNTATLTTSRVLPTIMFA